MDEAEEADEDDLIIIETLAPYIYQNGELTGYEVAKLTGISRSNVYGALSALADKGAAYLMEGNSSKYVLFCTQPIFAKDSLNIGEHKFNSV